MGAHAPSDFLDLTQYSRPSRIQARHIPREGGSFAPLSGDVGGYCIRFSEFSYFFHKNRMTDFPFLDML